MERDRGREEGDRVESKGIGVVRNGVGIKVKRVLNWP